MRPKLPQNDLVGSPRANSVFLTQGLKCHRWFSAHCANHILRQLGYANLLSTRWLNWQSLATLAYHIVCVVLRSPKPQVVRIAAQAIVACMQNPKAVLNFSVRYNPCSTVAVYVLPASILG